MHTVTPQIVPREGRSHPPNTIPSLVTLHSTSLILFFNSFLSSFLLHLVSMKLACLHHDYAKRFFNYTDMHTHAGVSTPLLPESDVVKGGPHAHISLHCCTTLDLPSPFLILPPFVTPPLHFLPRYRTTNV